MDALLLHRDDPFDPDEPQRGASDPGASVWVAASAGTGKTKVLSDRVLRLMLSGTDPRRILCLTYTRAAAAEMANRIARRLGEWATADDEALRKALLKLLGSEATEKQLHRARTLFAMVLDAPGGLGIQTIHAFCQSLLGRFPLEAEIAPHAQPMDEREATDLRQRALQDILAEAGRSGGPLAEALTGIVHHLRELRFGEIMAEIAKKPGRFEAMIAAHGSLPAAMAAVPALLGLAPDETAPRIIADGCGDDACDVPALQRAAAALARGSSDGECSRAARMLTWLEADLQTRAETFDEWAGIFLADLTKQPRVKDAKGLVTKATEQQFPGTLAVMLAEAERLACLLSRRNAAITCEATTALMVVGAALLHRYRSLKQSRALLDYADLIDGARRLLQSTEGDWVLYKLDGGLDHLLIDEAQDTAPAQWEILQALTAEFLAGESARQLPRTIFAVGDVKQSIFSFQGAEPRAFHESREHYGARVMAAGGNWRPLAMQTSFRSTRAVLAAVDATFATKEMTTAIALETTEIVHRAWRKLDGGSVEVWPPLHVRDRAKPPPAWEPPTQRSGEDAPQSRLARLIARRIEAMLARREPLLSQGRPIRAGDIMVLVRRRTQLVPALIRALKDLEVPVAGIDRMLLTEQLAVMDLLALVQFVLLPEDDLTLATVLKSPLVGFDEDALYALAQPRQGSLWQALRQAAAAGDPAAVAAHRYLAGLRADADLLPPYEFLMRALGPLPGAAEGGELADSGRRRLLARLGRDADDPIAELLEAALAFERTHPPSLQGFVAWLEHADVEIARDPETGAADAVRVMTVHGAKGLQAPIVFLPDSCQIPDDKFPLLWPKDTAGREVLLWPPLARFRETIANGERSRAAQRQHEEHMRLLYVAMTRAADRLIVCGWLTKNQKKHKKPHERSWHALIETALRTRIPPLDLIEEEDPFLTENSPGLADGTTALRLTCPQQAPTAHRVEERPIPADVLPAWSQRPAPDEPAPLRPLRPSHPGDIAQPPVISPLLAEQRFRRGRLIHRLLQELPELPAAARDAAAHSWLARPTHRLDPSEQAEIAAEVAAVLADPLLAPLFGPDGRAEVPLSGEIGGRLISGQIDRLVVNADAVTVLDLKSDRPPPRSAAAVHPAYLQQMAAYRALLRAIYPDRPVRCLLLWTQTPAAMLLDDALLDRWAP